MITTTEKAEIINKLEKDIVKFREEMGYTPISTNAVNLLEASSLCSIGATGNDISHLISLQEQGDKASQDDAKVEKYFMYAIILMVIGIIPLIYYLVMNKGA